jgi:hypothetical protein
VGFSGGFYTLLVLMDSRVWADFLADLLRERDLLSLPRYESLGCCDFFSFFWEFPRLALLDRLVAFASFLGFSACCYLVLISMLIEPEYLFLVPSGE